MRFQVRGRVDRARMFELGEQISDFLASYGVAEWCGMNVYLTPLETGTSEHVELMGADGLEIERATISNPKAVRRVRQSAPLIRLAADRGEEVPGGPLRRPAGWEEKALRFKPGDVISSTRGELAQVVGVEPRFKAVRKMPGGALSRRPVPMWKPEWQEAVLVDDPRAMTR